MTNTIAPPTLEELNERIVAIEDLRNTWRDLPSKTPFDLELYCLYAVRDGVGAKRQTELEDANNACIELAAKHGYATGHGDTVGDIMREFNAQIPDRAQSPWMDIETAPKDVELLLGWWRSGLERKWEYASGLAGSTKGGWLHGQATHWMPIPAPPTHNSPTDSKASHNG